MTILNTIKTIKKDQALVCLVASYATAGVGVIANATGHDKVALSMLVVSAVTYYRAADIERLRRKRKLDDAVACVNVSTEKMRSNLRNYGNPYGVVR